MDDAGQSRDRVLAPRSLTALYRGHRRAGRQLGQGRATMILATSSLADVVRGRRRSTNFERLAVERRTRLPSTSARHPLAALVAATTSTSRCSTAIMSPTTPARALSTPRPATGAKTSRSGWRTPRCSTERGIDTRIPYTVDENGVFTDEAPASRASASSTDKGKKGDANEAVIEALDRGRARSSRAAG